MNSQNEIIRSYCARLNLSTVPEQYSSLAHDAIRGDMTYTDYLEQLLSAELRGKESRRQKLLLSMAGFPSIKTLADFDFVFNQSVMEKQIREFASLSFIDKGENLIFLGPSGVGKTHLAISLGYLATQSNKITKFVTASDLVLQLESAQRQFKLDSYLKNPIEKSDLLIIDEIGYLPLNRLQSNLFFQVISKRYDKKLSTIVTSNLGFGEWGRIFDGDGAVTVAMLDRIIHHGEIVNIQGNSYRLKGKLEAKN